MLTSFKQRSAVNSSGHKTSSLVLQANREVSDPTAVKKLIAEGEEAASFIKSFVVQAKLNDRGNFGRLLSLKTTIALHYLPYKHGAHQDQGQIKAI